MGIGEREFFPEATLRICGNLDIEQAMVELPRYLQKFMPADRIILERYDDGLGSVRTVVHATLEGGTGGDVLAPMGHPPARELLAYHKHKASAFLELPLGTSDHEPGGMVLLADCGQYDEEQLRLMSLRKEPLQVSLSNPLQHSEIVRLKDRLA